MKEPFDSLLLMRSGWRKKRVALLLRCHNSKSNTACFKQETPACCRRPCLIHAGGDRAMASWNGSCGGVLTLMRVSENVNEVK